MTWNRRPLSVTILAWVYIGMGTVGFVYHLTEFQATNAFLYDGMWVELIRILAIHARSTRRPTGTINATEST